ncbi:hypothetical protein KIL84_003218 [Mauremys mutica]|uniref:Uncharacterized protein n=1 Tax=Mauremys mutica TaxID=74926 RepID=A0A9D3WVA7_9SAUR|nr:hypothetical protein KIL84_003218 [Mauremys mutica]
MTPPGWDARTGLQPSPAETLEPPRSPWLGHGGRRPDWSKGPAATLPPGWDMDPHLFPNSPAGAWSPHNCPASISLELRSGCPGDGITLTPGLALGLGQGPTIQGRDMDPLHAAWDTPPSHLQGWVPPYLAPWTSAKWTQEPPPLLQGPL